MRRKVTASVIAAADGCHLAPAGRGLVEPGADAGPGPVRQRGQAGVRLAHHAVDPLHQRVDDLGLAGDMGVDRGPGHPAAWAMSSIRASRNGFC
ncbi:hypothetical protein [Streptomyces sp. NPDC101455]|uniref:hypothetical protein n=1 Tax=Streptomyces sp. NPDC101455 TaxID=3366142 RepID=UPI00381B7FB7